jgi:uncharacterized membrane protein YhaH (DUF805 family)
MNENIEIVKKEALPAVESVDGQEQPSLGELYLAGPVLPICSPSFYRHAAKRPAFTALVFFVLFSLVVTVLHTVRATADFGDARQVIDEAFAGGRIPAVIVEDGIATVDAPQPYVAVDNGQSLIVLDTTGVYTGRELLDGGYESGLILTKDAVYSFDDEGRFQQTSLRDLNLLFPTIHFNAGLVKRLVNLAQVFVFAGLFFWHVIFRTIYIILLGLGVWSATSLAKKQVSYSAVLITGFYAAIPALYGEYLMGRIDANVFLLFTLLLLIIWTVGLVAAVGTRRAGDVLRGERTLRAWRALIGIPMLVIFALDFLYQWDRGPLIVWVTAAVTVAVLLIVGYLTGIRREEQLGPEKLLPRS